MRTRLVLAVALCAVAVAPTAAARQADPSEPEVQTHQYLHSHGVDTWHFTVSTKALTPPIVFRPRPTDRWMHIATEDVLDKPVLVHVYQRGDRGERDLRDIYCQKVNLYRLVSGRPVEVHLFTGLCPDHDFGYATAGTVTATFTRRL
jgi:hypothetical protein